MGRKMTAMSTAEAVNLMYPDATDEQKTLMTMGAEAAEAAVPEIEAEQEREATKDMAPGEKQRFDKMMDREDELPGNTKGLLYPRVKPPVKQAAQPPKSAESTPLRRKPVLVPITARALGIK